MQFSIGHVLAALDSTILNPWLTQLVPLLLHFRTDNKLVIRPSGGTIPYRIQTPLPPALYRALALFGVGFILRVNRYLSSRALNNGVESSFDPEKEIVLITGAAGGIGAKTAQMIAAKGARVVVIDVIPLTFDKRKIDTCSLTIQADLSSAANMHYYKCDITDFEALKEVAATIKKEVGAPTCVVANAGVLRAKTILGASQRDIEL